MLKLNLTHFTVSGWAEMCIATSVLMKIKRYDWKWIYWLHIKIVVNSKWHTKWRICVNHTVINGYQIFFLVDWTWSVKYHKKMKRLEMDDEWWRCIGEVMLELLWFVLMSTKMMIRDEWRDDDKNDGLRTEKINRKLKWKING